MGGSSSGGWVCHGGNPSFVGRAVLYNSSESRMRFNRARLRPGDIKTKLLYEYDFSTRDRTPAGFDDEAGIFFHAPAIRQGADAGQSFRRAPADGVRDVLWKDQQARQK